MHLTNYSVNKHNESFDNDDSCDKGSKRTIKFFNTWLAARGYCVSELWTRITVSLYTHTYIAIWYWVMSTIIKFNILLRLIHDMNKYCFCTINYPI